MTIRAKLYVAILLTVIGPVITIAVALHGMSRLGDRFDEVQERSDHRALALGLKFGVTDFNGWQTAYGYDDGASRPIAAGQHQSQRVATGCGLSSSASMPRAAELRKTAPRFVWLLTSSRIATRRAPASTVRASGNGRRWNEASTPRCT